MGWRNFIPRPSLGFAPWPKTATKKSTIRWIFMKLWREQSTSPCWRMSVWQPCGFFAPWPKTATKKIHHSVDFYETLVRAKYFAMLAHSSPRNPAGSSPLCIKTATKKSTIRWIFYETLVRAKGLEPSTSTLARLRSSQLSYARTVWHILTYLFLYCKYFFNK